MKTLETVKSSQSELLSTYFGLKEVFDRQISYIASELNIDTLMDTVETVDFWENLN